MNETSIVFAAAASEHASVLRQSMSVLGPSVLHKDERLSVRLTVSHHSQTWDVVIVGKSTAPRKTHNTQINTREQR